MRLNKSKINNKSDTASERKLVTHFAQAVGDFIRYWGFRRIHGQIWAAIYIHKEPLSGAQLTHMLSVSKALVSPALSELEEHGLIQHVGGDERTKLYGPSPNVMAVIASVLEKRERKLIDLAANHFSQLHEHARSQPEGDLSLSRMNEIKKLIEGGKSGVKLAVRLFKSEKDFLSQLARLR